MTTLYSARKFLSGKNQHYIETSQPIRKDIYVYAGLVSSFLIIIDYNRQLSFRWFWMESFHKNIQLILESLKRFRDCQHINCQHRECHVYKHETTLSSYVWHLKETFDVSPNLKCSVVRWATPNSNISKKCLLRLHEK